MKFARRAEGIKTARNVFKKAREDTRIKYHVFVAAALMEYYCTKVCNTFKPCQILKIIFSSWKSLLIIDILPNVRISFPSSEIV